MEGVDSLILVLALVVDVVVGVVGDACQEDNTHQQKHFDSQPCEVEEIQVTSYCLPVVGLLEERPALVAHNKGHKKGSWLVAS